jgi:hypothetical protein
VVSQAAWDELEALSAAQKLDLAERLVGPLHAGAPADQRESDAQLKTLLDRRWAEYLLNPGGAVDMLSHLRNEAPAAS